MMMMMMLLLLMGTGMMKSNFLRGFGPNNSLTMVKTEGAARRVGNFASGQSKNVWQNQRWNTFLMNLFLCSKPLNNLATRNQSHCISKLRSDGLGCDVLSWVGPRNGLEPILQEGQQWNALYNCTRTFCTFVKIRSNCSATSAIGNAL